MVDVKFNKMFKNEVGEDVYFLSMKIDGNYQVIPLTKEQFNFFYVSVRQIYNSLPTDEQINEIK